MEEVLIHNPWFSWVFLFFFCFFLFFIYFNSCSWHACCMTIAFGFCMSIGLFFPRYLKSFWWWFPMHILIQITGVILAITGFIIIFVRAGGNHFSYTHSWFVK